MGVSVADYYDGKSILIAGGSGFVGKVLLEKLLYSCPGIDKIYLLLRNKRSMSIEQRLLELLEQPVFTRLKKENPLALQKVTAVASDIALRNLGLSLEDESVLINKVSIVFHLAATIKFNESIENAFNINVGGTERIMSLCKRMKIIKKFVYVSTAYSNSDRSIIDEIIYPAPISLYAAKKRLIAGIITNGEIRNLLSGKSNVYTFTKAIAEEYIQRNHEHVPSVIIRPSIVTASLSEPLEGWIDSWAGAPVLVAGVGLGINRVLYGKFSNILDLIPVDYVSNLTIVAAAENNDDLEEVPVYNSCSSELNPVTIGMINSYIVAYSLKNKMYRSVRMKLTCVMNSDYENHRVDMKIYHYEFRTLLFPYIIYEQAHTHWNSDYEFVIWHYKRPNPGIVMSTSKSKVYLISLFQQVLPVYLADIDLRLKGNHSKNMKTVKRLLMVQKLLAPFTSNSWIIRAQRTRSLAINLSESDKALFPFNAEDIVWPEYVNDFCNGLKKYLLQS